MPKNSFISFLKKQKNYSGQCQSTLGIYLSCVIASTWKIFTYDNYFYIPFMIIFVPFIDNSKINKLWLFFRSQQKWCFEIIDSKVTLKTIHSLTGRKLYLHHRNHLLFHQIATFIKVHVAFVFEIPTLLLKDFGKIYRSKDLNPKNKDLMNSYECK